MKKLMFMLATVAMAIGVQAATVRWDTGTVNNPGTSTAASTRVQGYLFAITADQYSEIMAMEAAAASAKVYELYQAADSASLTAMKNGSPTASTAAKNRMFQGQGYFETTAANNSTVYSAIVLEYTPTGETDPTHYIGSVGMTSVSEDGDAGAINNLGSVLGGSNGTKALSWATPSSADVPEPTSGLLLVLGGAMLALRRRR